MTTGKAILISMAVFIGLGVLAALGFFIYTVIGSKSGNSPGVETQIQGNGSCTQEELDEIRRLQIAVSQNPYVTQAMRDELKRLQLKCFGNYETFN
jgi:hypothetical protein